MSHANPTPVRVGQSGTFAGKAYSIIARVVMGMEDQGETYYWNEFYLSDGSDRIAMLVCEEVYGGQQWRLFTEFTPATPLTAADAASKQVGDRMSLDGVSAEVTVVDETRVYEIEGNAPDWVSVGDVSKYFNAEAGGKMWVVSWSRDEVEYYRGMQLHPEMVAQALRLPVKSFKTAARSGTNSNKGCGVAAVLLVIAAGGFFLFRGCGSSSRISQPSPSSPPRSAPTAPVVQRHPAPASPLSVGMNFVLEGQTHRVISHRVTGLTKVNSQWNTHHYQTVDAAGRTNLLGVRVQSASTNWLLFKPLIVKLPPTPAAAASVRVGDTITLDDFSGRVTDLQMSHEVSRTGPPIAGFATNGLTYHYLATSSNGMMLASWTGDGIVFHLGLNVTPPVP